jgi:SOS-response transcriptional repressor LexA
MDILWFKAQQKRAGLTSFDLGQAIGRDRSVISRLANGTQKMTLDQARVIAERLGVPLAEMVQRAGLADAPIAQQLVPGFSESDAAPFVHGPGLAENAQVKTLAQAFGERAGVDVWRVKSAAMVLGGYLPGDFMLVDTHQAERARSGDVVLAQIYSRDSAVTVLRRFEAPVLVAASSDPADWRAPVVDGVNVVVVGKVVASWRAG